MRGSVLAFKALSPSSREQNRQAFRVMGSSSEEHRQHSLISLASCFRSRLPRPTQTATKEMTPVRPNRSQTWSNSCTGGGDDPAVIRRAFEELGETLTSTVGKMLKNITRTLQGDGDGGDHPCQWTS